MIYSKGPTIACEPLTESSETKKGLTFGAVSDLVPLKVKFSNHLHGINAGDVLFVLPKHRQSSVWTKQILRVPIDGTPVPIILVPFSDVELVSSDANP